MRKGGQQRRWFQAFRGQRKAARQRDIPFRFTFIDNFADVDAARERL